MVRLYVADARVQEILSDISATSDGPEVGLIVGQFSHQRDFILHVMQTPIIEGKNKDSPVSGGDAKAKKVALPGKSSNLETVLEKSISIHARQVRQMLTGGLDILGMLVFCPSEDFKTSQPKYKQLLHSLFNVVGKFDFLLPRRDLPTNRVLMHVCSITKKASCRSYDISDTKNSSTLADLKFQKLLDAFIGLKTSFSIRTTLYVEKKDMTHCLERQIINGLNPTIESIWDSVPVFNGIILSDDSDDGVDNSSHKSSLSQMPMEHFKSNNNEKEMKQRGVSDDGDEKDKIKMAGEDVKVDLLRSYANNVNKSASLVQCGAKILANGTISCRAFMHEKSSLSEGIKALKMDIIRSLLTRCELVCQDLLQGEEDQDVRAVYETPVRAFASLHNSRVLFSDYLFQDETSEDSVGRFREVLGLQDLNEDDVDQTKESIPDAEDLEQAETILNGKNSTFTELHPQNCHLVSDGNSWMSFLKPFISIPFSVLVGSVASLTASYWYLSQSMDEEAPH